MKKFIMRPVFAGPLIIVGLALLIVYALIPPPPCDWSWTYVRNELWQMPGGVGALLGAGLGLGAVAVAASLGFDNLITAQEHQADLDRKARESQIAADRKILAAGLAGELNSVITGCKAHLHWLRDMQKHMAGLANDDSMRRVKFTLAPVPFSECVFFRSSAGKIGLLGTALSGEVTHTYEILAGWRRLAENAIESYPEIFAKYVPRNIKLLEGWIPIFKDLVRRLEAIARGLPDPGQGPVAAAGEAGD